tara:strand:- start:40 stop:414 length:375 start_codon:yes stop_codon:yes gene_type:complete
MNVNGQLFEQVILSKPVTTETDGFVSASDETLPTPLAQNPERTAKFKQGGTPLKSSLLPTPMASLWKGVGKKGSKSSLSFAKKGYLTGVINESCSTPTGEAGWLNPSFLELMMGLPLGYTELKE